LNDADPSDTSSIIVVSDANVFCSNTCSRLVNGQVTETARVDLAAIGSTIEAITNTPRVGSIDRAALESC
jgi:hypothetical protein